MRLFGNTPAKAIVIAKDSSFHSEQAPWSAAISKMYGIASLRLAMTR